MLKKYLIVFLVSMVPLIELRGGVPIAVGMGLDYYKALAVCVLGNMLPVPVIYHSYKTVIANPYPDIVVDPLNAEKKA